MKRLIACLLLACTLLTLVPAAAFATPADPAPAAEERASETEWRYRVYNGVQQKRLWSITYGIWLTDWIDC